jgi:hypothetical protein
MAKKNNKQKKSNGRANLARLSSMLMLAKAGGKKKTKRAGRITGSSMGPVATINSAPVAIGNSVRGSQKRVKNIPNGVLVSGRDFMFAPTGSGTVTTWTCVGGTPLTPVAFSDATIRQYMQMYQKFRWRRLVAHYITAAPTSATGDVMFYYAKNRESVFLSQTSSQLLPFVMSDPDTVIGPQWTNHSTALTVTSTWKSTDYGMDDVPDNYADGDLFLLSKTTTTDNPGYVIMDYVVEFAEMQITPRLLSLPLPRAQWFQTNIGETSLAATAGSTLSVCGIVGNNLSGTVSANPTGSVAGDIYKVFIDITNSLPGSWVNCTKQNLFEVALGGTSTAEALTLVDGWTWYAMYDGSAYRFFSTAAAAYAGNEDIYFGVTATITFNLQVWVSLIGSKSSVGFAPNF